MATNFRRFNQDALDAYVAMIQKNHGETIKLKDVPALPPITQMLAGSADAMGENKNGKQWPIMVKKVWQSNFGPPKTIEEIAETRDNFYLEKDSDGQWRLKKDATLMYACQNVLACLGMISLDLVLYNERNADVLVVPVRISRTTYLDKTKELFAYLKDHRAFVGLTSIF